MRFFILIVSVMALTACNSDAKFKAYAKEAVSRDFKDPSSAQFRNLTVDYPIDRNDDEWPTDVCGEVNAKNSYGVYTGFKKFIYKRYPFDYEEVYFEETPGGKALIEIACN